MSVRRRRMLRFVAALALAGGALAVARLELLDGPLRYLPQSLVVVGVIILIAEGANWLVDASTRIARRLGVSELVIGLTVVALGTSAPEVAASLVAGFRGNGDITIANVVGSNIFNLCFVLGGVTLFLKDGMRTAAALRWRDGPILIGSTVLLVLFVGGIPGSTRVGGSGLFGLLDRSLQLGEGIVLATALVGYLYFLYRSRKDHGEDDAVDELPQDVPSTLVVDIALFLLGLALVVGGCHVLVGEAELLDGVVHGHGALWFAKEWGLPDYVVGITIVAAGTSAPELVISLTAALRGSLGISAGNAIGSSTFNVLGVVGVSGIVLQKPLVATPVTVSAPAVPGLLWLIALTALAVLFVGTGRRLTRLEALILVLTGLTRWIFDFTGVGA